MTSAIQVGQQDGDDHARFDALPEEDDQRGEHEMSSGGGWQRVRAGLPNSPTIASNPPDRQAAANAQVGRCSLAASALVNGSVDATDRRPASRRRGSETAALTLPHPLSY